MTIVVVKVFYFSDYETEAIIMIDIKNRATSVDAEKMNLRDNLGFIRVHEELLRSEPILRKVVEKLKLYEDGGFLPLQKPKKFVGSDLQKEKIIRHAIESLQKSVVTTSSPSFTNLIMVKARYKNAQRTAEIVNCLIKTYMEWNVNFHHDEVENIIVYLDKEADLAEQKLLKSEEDLRKFKDESHMVEPSEDVKLMYQFMKMTAEKELDLEVDLMRQKELYTDESPQVKYLKENIDALKRKLQGISVNERFKEIPEKEMLLIRLQRSVVINETAYRFLVGEQEKAQLIKAKQTTENIKIVSPAATPLKPKGRLTGLAIGLLMSLILTVGVPFSWRHRKSLIG
jgi:uncharacterized protein involved in exopolysaccharide biosynthesis